MHSKLIIQDFFYNPNEVFVTVLDPLCLLIMATRKLPSTIDNLHRITDVFLFFFKSQKIDHWHIFCYTSSLGYWPNFEKKLNKDNLRWILKVPKFEKPV